MACLFEPGRPRSNRSSGRRGFRCRSSACRERGRFIAVRQGWTQSEQGVNSATLAPFAGLAAGVSEGNFPESVPRRLGTWRCFSSLDRYEQAFVKRPRACAASRNCRRIGDLGQLRPAVERIIRLLGRDGGELAAVEYLGRASRDGPCAIPPGAHGGTDGGAWRKERLAGGRSQGCRRTMAGDLKRTGCRSRCATVTANASAFRPAMNCADAHCLGARRRSKRELWRRPAATRSRHRRPR